jgi:hypothetical protein
VSNVERRSKRQKVEGNRVRPSIGSGLPFVLHELMMNKAQKELLSLLGAKMSGDDIGFCALDMN